MKKYTIPVLVLPLLLWVAAPAAAQNKEHMQMAAELRMLQEQNQQLSLALQQTMKALEAINGRVDAAMEAMRKGFADQALATKNVAADVSTIAERARDTDTKLRTLSDEITALQATVTAVAAAIAQGAGAVPAAPADSSAAPTSAVPGALPPAPTPALGSTIGVSPTRMLEQAKADYYRGQYANAITGFEQLINTPQLANTEAAGEAQYWIGESHYNLSHWNEAIAAYNLVLQKTPRASYAAEALYKRGEAQRRLGDIAAARASYEQVIAQYADTNAALLAQQRLSGLPAANSAPARP